MQLKHLKALPPFRRVVDHDMTSVAWLAVDDHGAIMSEPAQNNKFQIKQLKKSNQVFHDFDTALTSYTTDTPEPSFVFEVRHCFRRLLPPLTLCFYALGEFCSPLQ